ncbi:hydantoinase B/oxoprolinase family protein [Brucella grignonensis]
MTMAPKEDHFTIEIIQNSLQAICDEMFAVMQKTSMSAIIYEVLDMGTAIVDEHGNLASAGAGIPLFIAGMDKTVSFIKKHCEKTGMAIEDGDIFVTNDPYYGGITHLNDVIFAMPVFKDGEIVAWTTDIAHWNDVGGMVPGSMAPNATEIFQEGLRLPAVKIVEKGKTNHSLIETMKINSRMPSFLEGDLWAGIAAVRIGAKRILETVDKYSAETFRRAIAEYLDYGERVTLGALKRLPKGTFTHTEEQDDGIVNSCTITIEDAKFIVDLRDNPANPGPFNISRHAALLSAQLLIKSIADDSPICNGGNFRPIEFLTKKGTMYDPEEPAPQGIYYEMVVQLYDLLWRCLAKSLPGMLPAGQYASMCATVIGGTHPDTGRAYALVEPQLGGWGAFSGSDGASAIFTGFHGLTFNCPAEINEARNGIIVQSLCLNDDQGGEGEYRGGRGIKAEYLLRSKDPFLTICYRRSKNPPWALEGGNQGTPNYVEILGEDGSIEKVSVLTNRKLKQNDVIRIVTGNGGGYGKPADRDEAQVWDDIKNGYISKDRARDVYGVS